MSVPAKRVYSAISGDHIAGDPPVLIPNTEVKPCRADGTNLATDWESRSSPLLFLASVAQWLERSAVNRNVVGSNPTGPTKIKPYKLTTCEAFLSLPASLKNY